MSNLTFHMVGLAHIETTKENSACAYTQKIIKLCDMIKSYGHKLYFYGVEGSEVSCDEFIEVSNRDILSEVYGDYNRKTSFYRHNPNDKAHRIFNENTIEAINQLKDKNDILLCPMGNYHKSISEGTSLLTVEPGIGYEGFFSPCKVFESYAWMHYVYGKNNIENGIWYDGVIPNYFQVEDFEFCDKKEEYLLYFGRIIGRKGVMLASEIAKATGHILYVVGQGSINNPDEGIFLQNEKHIKYMPAVEGEERSQLMKKAKAVIMPTYYIEPFGGVNVEAQLCGTPVITTDWGAFPETVLHGVTGYRCRVWEEFCYAVNNIDKIKPENCRKWAEENFSTKRVGEMYEEYFQRVARLFGDGWYSENKERKNFDCLKKYF